MKLWEIDEQIKAVAPIHGINSNGDIDFKPEVTEAEKSAAQQLMAGLLLKLDDSLL